MGREIYEIGSKISVEFFPGGNIRFEIIRARQNDFLFCLRSESCTNGPILINCGRFTYFGHILRLFKLKTIASFNKKEQTHKPVYDAVSSKDIIYQNELYRFVSFLFYFTLVFCTILIVFRSVSLAYVSTKLKLFSSIQPLILITGSLNKTSKFISILT